MADLLDDMLIPDASVKHSIVDDAELSKPKNGKTLNPRTENPASPSFKQGAAKH